MTLQSMLEQLSAGGAAWVPGLLDVAAKGVVVMALTGITALAMRRSSAAGRHLVWFLGICSLLILPLLCAALPGWHILPQSWPGASVGSGATASLQPTAQPLVRTMPPPGERVGVDLRGGEGEPRGLGQPADLRSSEAISASRDYEAQPRSHVSLSWQSWLLLSWATGTLFLLGHVALGLLSLRWLEYRSTRVSDVEWLALLLQLRTQLGIRRPVDLLSSSRRTMPMTWGLWRTRLLLPQEAATWTPEQRRAVLLHELAHAKRWDCLSQLVVQIACALYWFNPLVWLAWHRIQTERERACDDLVLATGAKATAYAEQLLRIASEMPAPRLSAAAIAMARPGKLEGRLLAILDVTRNRRALTSLGIAVGITALLAVVLPLAMVRAGTATAPSAKVAPLLRFVGTPSDDARKSVVVWRPNGQLAGEPDRRLLDRHPARQITTNPLLTQHGLYLWFSHPQFDQFSSIQLRFFSATGKELRVATASDGRIEPAEFTEDGLGWAGYCAAPVSPEEPLPDTMNIELRYSVGDWNVGQVIAADRGTPIVDADFGTVTIAQTDGGNSCITLISDPSQVRDTQFGAKVINQAGKEVFVRGTGQSGNRFQQFLEIPRAQVRSFQLRKRPIQTVVFTNVSTQVGHLTQPSTMPATQPATQRASEATLPNGVTIELVGIAPSVPSTDPVAAPPANTWFSPAGLPITAPYTSLAANFRQLEPAATQAITDFLKQIRSRPNARECAFVLRGLDHETQPAYTLSLPGSREPLLSSAYPAVYRYDGDGKDWWTYTSLIHAFYRDNPAGDRVNIRVTLASGPSAVSGTAPVDRASVLTVDGSPILVGQTIEANGHARFNIEYDPAVHTVRIVAVSRSGREYPNASNAGATMGPANDSEHPGFERDILDLSEPSLKDIDHLVIRTRPMCWAEFRNVPLKAGLANALEIAAGFVAQPAASVQGSR